MFEKVRKVISAQLKTEEEKITLNSNIKEDLGADSVDILQMLMTLEDEYNVQIPDEKLIKFNTVNDIVEYLDSIK